MKKILFVDRDGTLMVEPPDTEQIDGLEQIELMPGVISSLKRFADAGYEIVIVTNQDGLDTPANPRENYEAVNAFFFRLLKSEGIMIRALYECPHTRDAGCTCRKPLPGILGDDFLLDEVDREHSLMVGDRQSDLQFAENLGIRGFFLPETSWAKLTREALDAPRTAEVKRTTKETDISVRLTLDGSGEYRVDTGLKFFDHMLEQLSKHSGFDLELTCNGDLAIDEHHTIEDVGLALGECFRLALGDKRGIARYASERLVPMDEARADVAIDLSGRPYLQFEAEFSREYVGDFPTEMLGHFLRSFCEAGKINLHLALHGDNTHHLVEVAFKGLARCLRDAVRREGDALPSTKGVL